jgi:DivIVA domain-containing protein
MGSFVLVSIIVLVIAALVFGVFALLSGDDPGLGVVEADHVVPLPGNRPLLERDVSALRFDTSLRGYRMVQVDRALRRAAYDIGYKDEMISVLEAEVAALRDGRTEEAELMRKAREDAAAGSVNGPDSAPSPVEFADGVTEDDVDAAVESERAADFEREVQLEHNGPHATGA